MKRAALIAVLMLMAGACASERSDSHPAADPLSHAPEAATRAGEPVPNSQALLRPGDIGGGQYVLPNGRRITPAGTYVQAFSFPIDVAVSPDGATAILASTKRTRIAVIDVDTATVTQQIAIGNSFSGMVFNSAGDRFWVSGGASHVIYEFTLSGGVATLNATIPVANMPSGMALSPDESRLYTACYLGKRVAVIDLAESEEIDSYPVHLFPYDVRVSPDGETAYVSNHGVGTVSVLDLTDHGSVIAELPAGANPEMMALSPDGSRLYVPNSDSDDITVIDTGSLEVVDTFELASSPAEPYGTSPTAVEVTQDGSRLFVTSSTYNSVDVLDAQTGEMLGRIPAGWYPTNSFLDEAHGKLFIANGKGVGSAGRGLYDATQGGLSIVDLPTDEDLLDLWDEVEDNVTWATRFFDLTDVESPIPTERGVPSEQIKHVVYVLRENKTFDQVLASFPGAEGDTGLQSFDETIIPNAYKLGGEYTLLDNTYTEGDTSVLGHLWASYNNVNDHAEKAYVAGGIYPLPDIDPNTRPQSETIFDLLLDHEIPFRSYGQIIGLAHNLDRFGPYVDFKYGFWNMGVSDEVKVDEIIREVEAGIFEPFTYISLPNDHTYGSSSGAPTVDYLMGDNDAALGKLVQFYSSLPEWESTVIFVIEDDPQSGTDHIDPHRTAALVIGPHVKHGYVSKVLYSMPSVWATIGMILGVPPMNQYDAFASPMYDVFTMTPNTQPYVALPNPTPYEVTPSGLPMQAYCDSIDWTVPDSAERLGEVIWALKNPGRPWPYEYSLNPTGMDQGEDEDEAEEAEDAAERAIYREQLAKALDYAKAHGIEIRLPESPREFVRPR